MKNLTSKTTMTIRAAMILLLAAGAATPRGVQSTSRGNGMGSHPMPARSGSPAHVNIAPSHQSSSPAMRPHNPGPVSQGHNPTHTQPAAMPHSMPHSTPHSMPHSGAMAHSNPGGYSHPGGGYRHEPVHGRYVQRTVVRGGYSHMSYYRPYRYRGIEFHAYAPMHFFAPRFYGWVDAPWAFRVHYRWGWFGSPWFAAYRGYFTPYPVYSGAPFWLTDYLVATSLQESWQAGAIGPSFRYGMSDSVKQAVAMEVHRQILIERAEAAGSQTSAPAFLDGQSHAFVVTNPTTANAGNQACSLTGGDVVQLDGNSPVNGDNATVQVVASKGQDCVTGSYVGVTLAQLQEMQNGMRETIDQGLTTLQAEQGQNGLPAAPAGM